MQFAEHYEEVCCRIDAACARSTRLPGDVRVLPVSKKQEPEAIAAAADCGVEVFGESRVQEALQKIPLCSSRLEWHMIGHLQSNKVRHFRSAGPSSPPRAPTPRHSGDGGQTPGSPDGLDGYMIAHVNELRRLGCV